MNIITCIDNAYGIGNKGKLLYHIEKDMERFVELTKRSGIVIMGMETYRSIGKPLPERKNIVLTRTEQHSDFQNLQFVSNVDMIFNNPEFENAFIIGGEEIYRLFYPFCDTAYVTYVLSRRPHDKTFPFRFYGTEWNIIYEWNTNYVDNLYFDEKEQVTYRFLKLERRKDINERRN